MWNRHDFEKQKKQRQDEFRIYNADKYSRTGAGPLLDEYNAFNDKSKLKIYGSQKYTVPKSQEYFERTERIKAFKDPRQKNIFYNVMSPNQDMTKRMIESDFLEELGQFPEANKFDLNRKLSEREIKAAKDEEKRLAFLKAYKNHQNLPVGIDIEDRFLRWIGQADEIKSERFKLKECNILEKYIMCYANKQPVPKFMTKDGKRPSLKETIFSPRFVNTVQQKYQTKQTTAKVIYKSLVFETKPLKQTAQNENQNWRNENWAKDLQVLHSKDDSADRFRIKEILAESDHQHDIFVNQIEQLENVSEEVKGLLHELKGVYEEHKWCLGNEYNAEYEADKNNPLTPEQEEAKNRAIKHYNLHVKKIKHALGQHERAEKPSEVDKMKLMQERIARERR